MYYEQPTVEYRNEAIIYAYQDGSSLAYSTNNDLNARFTNKIVSPSIKVINANPIKPKHKCTF